MPRAMTARHLAKRAHVCIVCQAVSQPVQTFGNSLSRMTRHVFGTDVDFDPGNDSRINDDFDQGSAIVLPLADRFIVENRPTDGLSETRRGDDQLPIRAPGFLRLRNPQPGESLVTSRNAFIDCQKTFVMSNQRPRGVEKRLCIHLGLLHFQSRISGMSTPFSLM